MTCRQCGTVIADKAIVCYRCGTPTADPSATTSTAAAVRRRSAASIWLAIGLIAGGLTAVSLDHGGGSLLWIGATCATIGVVLGGLALARRSRLGSR